MNIVHNLIKPKSVAVIGASRSRDKVGYQVLRNIIDSGFLGEVYPINPHATTIHKQKVYASILDTPTIPELAIIVTPQGLVEIVLQECIQKGVPTAIIITAGFAESDHKGEQAQERIQKMRHNQIRLLGPNCLGVISPVNKFNASFGPQFENIGNIMLISQSGAMVTGVLDWSHTTNLGISHCITMGNRIDISENDVLQFAASDKDTQVILTYLESFQNAPEFFSIASKITPHKPIILLKGGSSKSGQKASASHTAALATDQTLISAFAQQTGVILSTDIERWLQTAQICSQEKPLAGDDVAIITNAGGPGVVASDEAESKGLVIQPLTKKSQRQLENALEEIAPHNPLDIRGDAVPEDFATALKIVLQDKIQDSILIIITPQTTTQPKEAVKLIIKHAKNATKPVLVVLLGGSQMLPAKKLLDEASIPNFTFPNQAIQLLTTKNTYQNNAKLNLQFPATHVTTLASKPFNEDNLNLKKAFRLLKQFNFNLPKYQIISQISHVPSAMRAVGKPAVIKTASMSITHKVLAGGVVRHIMTNHQARIAFRQMTPLHSHVLFQQTIKADVEVILGAKKDPALGSFVTVGIGGSLTNTIADRQYAFIPTQKSYIKKLIQQSKLYQHIKTNSQQVEQVLGCLDSLQSIMLSHPEISEIEINPLLLTANKAYAVDIKIKIDRK